MKIVVLAAVMLASVNSFASSITFKKGTGLPARVQAELTQLLETKCSYVFQKNWQVEESITESYQSPLAK